MAKQRKADKTEIYRIAVTDEERGRVLWERKFTRTLLWLSAAFAVGAVVLLTYCLIAFTPVRTTIPGYPDARMRNVAVQNAIKIDSLENIISRWALYAENLKRVVDGEKPLDVDSIIRRRSSESAAEADASALAGRDSLLRKTVKDASRFELDGADRKIPVEGLHFLVPLKGVVTKGYDKVMHPYIDVTAPAGSLVLSVLDGTVIFADWTDDMGYVVGVQHSAGLITFYKHNQKLLKAAGDQVKAGTPIALVGSADASSAGDHLHFELWRDGEPVDPTQYISF